MYGIEILDRKFEIFFGEDFIGCFCMKINGIRFDELPEALVKKETEVAK